MEIGFRTDVGRKRKSNQDAVGVFQNQEKVKLAIVADGMGGHQAGDVASHLTVFDLGEAWKNSNLTEQEDVIQWLLKQIQQENEEIFDKGQEDPSKAGMGTTIVAVVIIDQTVLLAHVGDSRFYLVRNGKIKQITEDHSLVNELVKSGEITPEMASHHPRKNVLVRSIGIPGTVEVDLTALEVTVGDKLLLCSDGLTNMVSDQDIMTIIDQAANLDEALDKLIEAANEAGGTDNITVLLIDYNEKGEGAND